ncbi:DUF2812 domain-containing protein [Thermodesulfobacteriota bacterium]
MSNRVVKFRIFPVWNMDGELKWLEEMASLGFRLVNVWPAIYFFERTEPESVHFCHGFDQVKFKDRDEYFQLYADAGWQYVSSCAGWHYFKSNVATATDMDKVTVTQDNAKFLKSFALFCLVLTVLYSFFLIGSWITGFYLEGILLGGGMGLGCLVFSYLLLSYARRRQLANLKKIQGNHKE